MGNILFVNLSLTVVTLLRKILIAHFTGKNILETDEFRGSEELLLRGSLDADDRSPGSWQHAQLFRQSIGDNDFPFEIDITFYDDPNSRSSTMKTDTDCKTNHEEVKK